MCYYACWTDASTLNTPVEESDAAAKDDEDDEGLNVRHTDADASRPTVAPRWPTRVFAIECMRKVMAVCDGNDNHFSLATAKALRQSGKGCYFFVSSSRSMWIFAQIFRNSYKWFSDKCVLNHCLESYTWVINKLIPLQTCKYKWMGHVLWHDGLLCDVLEGRMLG